MEYFEEISNDALTVRGFQEYKPSDYHLGKNHITKDLLITYYCIPNMK